MATHTTTGGDYGRKFAISRENGQADKNGRPYFFEWLQSLPADQGKRKFETRVNGKGENRHYELFSALDGFLIDISQEVKTFEGSNAEKWLKCVLTDAGDEYHIEIGRLDSRYSMDLMKRLLDPHFNPNQKLRLAPIASEPKVDSKGGIFLSAYSGVDKLEARHDCPHLAGMPQPITREWKGKTEYDWTPGAEWLYDRVMREVYPRLMQDPLVRPAERTPIPPPQAGFPTTAQTAPAHHAAGGFPETEIETDDSLPF